MDFGGGGTGTGLRCLQEWKQIEMFVSNLQWRNAYALSSLEFYVVPEGFTITILKRATNNFIDIQ